MLLNELFEGGWDTTVTQGTVIKPAVVSAALNVVKQFETDFNAWLAAKGIAPVKIGRPTGSAAYYKQDIEAEPNKVYGDIDLQMIAPPVEGLTYGQYTTYWNKLADEFVKATNPSYVHQGESKPGHPIISLGKDAYVQVDFMWHEPKMSAWGAARVTPERGIKGLLFGNMFSVLGELLDMSIQHAGVQLKTQNGQQVPFSKQKDVKVLTISADPKNFVSDIFKYLAQQQGIESPKVDPMLAKFPGNDPEDVKISKLVNSVKGLAQSLEANGMFGKGELAKFGSAQDFINKFLARYEEKAMADVNAKKREKANTPDAIARAESDKQKVLSGLATVKSYFSAT